MKIALKKYQRERALARNFKNLLHPIVRSNKGLEGREDNKTGKKSALITSLETRSFAGDYFGGFGFSQVGKYCQIIKNVLCLEKIVMQKTGIKNKQNNPVFRNLTQM